MSMKKVGCPNNSIQHDPCQNPRESPTAISKMLKQSIHICRRSDMSMKRMGGLNHDVTE
jgi:hypothetical protein